MMAGVPSPFMKTTRWVDRQQSVAPLAPDAVGQQFATLLPDRRVIRDEDVDSLLLVDRVQELHLLMVERANPVNSDLLECAMERMTLGRKPVLPSTVLEAKRNSAERVWLLQSLLRHCGHDREPSLVLRAGYE